MPSHCSTEQGNPLRSFPAFHCIGSDDHHPHLSPAHCILLLSTYSMWVPLAPQSLTFRFKRPLLRNSPEVSWLGLLVLTAGGLGSYLRQETASCTAQPKHKTRQKPSPLYWKVGLAWYGKYSTQNILSARGLPNTLPEGTVSRIWLSGLTDKVKVSLY